MHGWKGVLKKYAKIYIYIFKKIKDSLIYKWKILGVLLVGSPDVLPALHKT
jgi:hypothetical protein